MLQRLFFVPVLFTLCCLKLWSADATAALECYKTGNYPQAIPLLQAATADPAFAAPVRSALLSALTYEGRVDEGATLETQLATDFPNDPQAMTARGDFLFYMGDVTAAEKLYRAALKIKEENARAYYGLYRLFHAASHYKTARIFCLRAHSLDPDDSLITLAFIHYTVGEKRREMLGPFMAAHPWFAQSTSFEMQEKVKADVHQQLAERKAFELEGPRGEATVPLNVLMHGANMARGIGIQVSIDGGKPLRLLLDTGASGILLKQEAVDRAGLKHVGSTEFWGIGDKGVRKGFLALSEACSIGTLKFKNCIFQAQEGKGRIAGEDDGLVGTDFFDDYLIHLDFQRLKMSLKPLPDMPPSSGGYDRTFPANETQWTPVFRFGHALMLPTLVNGKSSGLFLIDTGASVSMMDSTFGRLSTKLHGNQYMRITGASGRVKDVFEADKAELQFGHFRQNNLGLTSVDLNNSGRHQELRMSGILGLPVLALFHLDIDYRNGLVNLDYVLK